MGNARKVILLVAAGLASSGCGDNWPKAIEIGVTVGRDAGVACVDVIDGEIVPAACPDAGADAATE
jgi:hypothetical protein